MLTQDFLLAGRASFVVRNPQNESVTVMLRRVKTGARAGQYYVSIRHNNDAWMYAGVLSMGADFGIVSTPKATATPKAMAVAIWAMNRIVHAQALPAGYTLTHTGRCGKCGRMLRDPESIRTGLGPHCGAR